MSREEILRGLHDHPDWYVLGVVTCDTGFAVLLSYRPSQSHGSVWYRAIGGNLFSIADARCAD